MCRLQARRPGASDRSAGERTGQGFGFWGFIAVRIPHILTVWGQRKGFKLSKCPVFLFCLAHIWPVICHVIPVGCFRPFGDFSICMQFYSRLRGVNVVFVPSTVCLIDELCGLQVR